MEYLKNLNSAFKLVKVLSLTSIVLSFGMCGVFYYVSELKVAKSREKIYVMTNGDVLQFALSKNMKENRGAEGKNHIQTFINLFFEMDPDPNDIKSRIDRALVLIDNSGMQMNASRKESLYYHKIVEGSISSRVKIDSIKLDVTRYPYPAAVYGKQRLIRPSNILYKDFIASCQLRDVKRTEDNPHGMLIENFRLIDNQTIDEKSRN